MYNWRSILSWSVEPWAVGSRVRIRQGVEKISRSWAMDGRDKGFVEVPAGTEGTVVGGHDPYIQVQWDGFPALLEVYPEPVSDAKEQPWGWGVNVEHVEQI